jgi:adrenodoxin-NADP+ reductase
MMMLTLISLANCSGVVPNRLGRVLSHEGASTSAEQHTADVRGLYVVGWLKRGPTGIIGTNLIDAEETVG